MTAISPWATLTSSIRLHFAEELTDPRDIPVSLLAQILGTDAAGVYAALDKMIKDRILRRMPNGDLEVLVDRRNVFREYLDKPEPAFYDWEDFN